MFHALFTMLKLRFPFFVAKNYVSIITNLPALHRLWTFNIKPEYIGIWRPVHDERYPKKRTMRNTAAQPEERKAADPSWRPHEPLQRTDLLASQLATGGNSWGDDPARRRLNSVMSAGSDVMRLFWSWVGLKGWSHGGTGSRDGSSWIKWGGSMKWNGTKMVKSIT